MSLVAASQPTPQAEPEIESGAFWPAIDPAQVREAQRIDGTVTIERLRAALIEAIAEANAGLAAWRAEREAEGIEALDAVDAEEIDGVSVLVHRYQRAVGCAAKATLLERYRDLDTTARGERKAEALADPIDDLRRDARWALADIRGVGRSTVELI